MSFDDYYKDPSTVITAQETPSNPYWRDLGYLSPELLDNIETNLSSSYLTPAQTQIFSSFSPESKIYNIISPPNTGVTTGLVILSHLISNNSENRIKAIWISHSLYNTFAIKKTYQKLLPSYNIQSETSSIPADIYLLSAENEVFKKRSEALICQNASKINFLVIDNAGELLQTKLMRDWLGSTILSSVFQPNSQAMPIVYFTQLFSTTTVNTFIRELDRNLTEKIHAITQPRLLETQLETFRAVRQYYAKLIGDPTWVKKLLGNLKIRVRKAILVFGEASVSDFDMISYIEINERINEHNLSEAIERIRKGEKKIGVFRSSLSKKFKTSSIGCVIHYGIPIQSSDIDINEYRSRVERAFSPQYTGISIIICKDSDNYMIRELSSKLSVVIEDYLQ